MLVSWENLPQTIFWHGKLLFIGGNHTTLVNRRAKKLAKIGSQNGPKTGPRTDSKLEDGRPKSGEMLLKDKTFKDAKKEKEEMKMMKMMRWMMMMTMVKDDGDDEDDNWDPRRILADEFWEKPFAGQSSWRSFAIFWQSFRRNLLDRALKANLLDGAWTRKSSLRGFKRQMELSKPNLLDGALKGKSSWRSFKRQIFLTEL